MTRESLENNVRNKEVMLRKMYKSSGVRKSVLGKMPKVWFFYPIINPLIAISTPKYSSNASISQSSL